MATITRAKIFNNGDVVTPAALHELIDSATIPPLVNADISAAAAIADTKLATISTANKVAQSAVTNLVSDLAGKASSTHTHGNITNAGAIGSTANLPVVTTASGVLSTIAAGSAGQVLTSNGGSTAPSWQTLAATSTNANNLTGGSAGTVPYQSASGTTAMLAAGSSGQVLRSNGAAAPAWLTLAASATTDTTNAANISSGTLANARTTATNANTGNTIVSRDASGNFLAGTITANLSGTATTVADKAITNAKLRDSSALSVIGNAANVSASPADIAANTDGHVLRRSGTSLGFGTVATNGIADSAITAAKLDGDQTGSAPIFGCRAWVNFNGTTSEDIGGTYSRNGTTVTVDTTVDHGFLVGHTVYLDFSTGTATDGLFTIASTPTTKQFTVVHGTAGTTNGNVTLPRRSIRSSGNVSNVTYHNAAGTYTVNFSTALPDANYALAGFANYTSGSVAGFVGGNNTHAPSSVACDIRVANSTTGNELNVSHVNVIFIR